MANNQYVNKVIYGSNTLIDLSQDTVAAGNMLSGYTAHDASGAAISGSIATKTGSDMTLQNNTLTIPAGYYASGTKTITGVELTVPESGTNSFDVTLPNGENDTITLTFEVDSEGNSNVTDDTGGSETLTAAEGVSF